MESMPKVEYSTQYNDKFRPISNEAIVTVEISPTGSGKTRYYRDSPNTLMLMPTNALVRQNGGLVSKTKAFDGERTEWNQIDRSKCDYMTYNKFLGHLLVRADISDMNIIIDEAHLLLISDNPTYSELAKILFTRSTPYKELKLITATIRDEVLDFYSQFIKAKTGNDMSVCKYVKANSEPLQIFCYDKIPQIDPSKKTLFFLNSKIKILQMKQHLETKYPNIKICILSSNPEQLPTEDKFENNDVIFSTSIIKQGYSIETHIDELIIHNVYNPVGAVDILQYIARPRNNQPKIILISSKNAFSREIIPEQEETYINEPNIWNLFHTVSRYSQNGYKDDTDIASINEAFQGNKLALSIQNGNPKISLIALYYENLMKFHENKISSWVNQDILDYGSFLRKSMAKLSAKKVEFIRINSEAESYDYEDVRFHRVDLDEIQAEFFDTFDELKEALLSIVEDEEEEEARKIKAQQYLEIELITTFKFNNVSYQFTNKVLIMQMLEKKILERCKQHITNINNNIYQHRFDAVKSDRRIIRGTEINLANAKKRLSFIERIIENYNIRMRISLETERDILKTLQKLYSFERYSDKEMTRRLSDSRMVGVKRVKITSPYPVELDWFEEIEQNDFLELSV